MDKQNKMRLNRAVDRLPKPHVDQLWETPVRKMAEHDYITRQEQMPNRTSPPLRRIAISFACLTVVCLAALGWHLENGMVAAVVDLDVNPSFELKINRKQAVLSVKGLNEEAKEILEGQTYKGWDVGDTVEKLILSLNEEQYLVAGVENAVLLSVSARDEERADELAKHLSLRIRETRDQKESPITVLRQSYVQTGESVAPQGISEGKLRLAESLAARTNRPVEELLRLTIEEMERLIAKTGPSLKSLTVDRSAWLTPETEDEDDHDPVSSIDSPVESTVPKHHAVKQGSNSSFRAFDDEADNQMVDLDDAINNGDAGSDPSDDFDELYHDSGNGGTTPNLSDDIADDLNDQSEDDPDQDALEGDSADDGMDMDAQNDGSSEQEETNGDPD